MHQNKYLWSKGLTLVQKDKIVDLSESKAFADDKLNVTQNLKFALERVENIVGKGENTDYQHFFPFPTVFSKAFFSRV